MNDVFIKKTWEEEGIVYYIHFHDKMAIRQIEVHPDKRIYLSEKDGSTMLCDQSIDILEIEQSDFISEEEFEIAWKKKEE